MHFGAAKPLGKKQESYLSSLWISIRALSAGMDVSKRIFLLPTLFLHIPHETLKVSCSAFSRHLNRGGEGSELGGEKAQLMDPTELRIATPARPFFVLSLRQNGYRLLPLQMKLCNGKSRPKCIFLLPQNCILMLSKLRKLDLS
jgi:hypothetical protein